MFDHTVFDKHTERDLLLHILKGIYAMALDVSKLNAATDKLSTDVNALIAAHTDPAAQAEVDVVTTRLAAISALAEAALAPPAPPAA